VPSLGDGFGAGRLRHAYGELRARFADVLLLLTVPFGLLDARVLRLASKARTMASLTFPGTPSRAVLTPEPGMARICVVREYSSGVPVLSFSSVAVLTDALRGRPALPHPELPSPTS
jgi:hypothetical protein